MADQDSSRREEAKRMAQSAAKVVLAKHPSVVAGSARPAPVPTHEAPPRPLDTGTRNIGRALER
jgi:hypothetical protein